MDPQNQGQLSGVLTFGRKECFGALRFWVRCNAGNCFSMYDPPPSNFWTLN